MPEGKNRRQCTHDPHYHIKKYDKYGNINPEWKRVYNKEIKKRNNYYTLKMINKK